MFVHCCHCRWCQRETGSAFVLNAMIEAENVEVTGDVVFVDIPTLSGRGQRVARCPQCQIALWSNYGGRGDIVRFVRVGTLDNPDAVPPDAHIFTDSKVPWVLLPPGVAAFGEFYDRAAVWPAAARDRLRAAMARAAR
jgi:hypothetical protein